MGVIYLGYSGCGFPMRQQSSEVWIEIGRFTSNMAPLHGCWQETAGSHYTGLSIALLVFPCITVTDFPRVGDPEESKVEVQSPM